MDSLSKCYSSSPSLIRRSSKALDLTSKLHVPLSNCFRKHASVTPHQAQVSEAQNSYHVTTTSTKFFPIEVHQHPHFMLQPHLSFLCFGLSCPFPCFASETTAVVAEDASSKINLESVLVSIDNFFNRYPFFVATVTFIWLVVIPLTEEYLQKYKFVSAINAFKKLQNDPNCQLLDIRDSKSAAYLSPPNLKMLNKSVVQVEYREGEDEQEGFLKRVLENFSEPANTSVCIIDNFDGNSIKVAELLVKNNFKEAYAIRGGLMGQKGWQEIQEELLPPSVHVFPKTITGKASKQLKTNGGVSQQDINSIDKSPSTSRINKDMIDNKESRCVRPLSPYPYYPDLKPPSSPTPSKPK